LHDARDCWDRLFARAAPELRDAPTGRDISDIAARLRAASVLDVLDVGCGLGRWSTTLARAGFRVTAVDISPEAVRIVQDRAQREGLSIATAVCAAQDLACLGVQVDGMVCNSVLDHMPPVESARAVVGMTQALKPGGLLHVSFDGRDESHTESAAQPEYVTHPDGTREYVSGSRRGMHWRFYNDAEIRRLFREFEEVGFIVAPSGQRQAWFRKPDPETAH
jgi:2-polyprenyl-3-methyl-5-hydroxy-6-metoxy-1,4-benzoquinol methylase